MSTPLEPEAVCNLCGFPAVRMDGRWVHAEPADTVFCSIINGTLIIEEDQNDADMG